MGTHSVWFRSGGLGSGATQLVADTQVAGFEGLRYGRGINRGGVCKLVALDPGANPAPGDYLEVRYGSTPATDPPVWSGVIREANERKEDPGVWDVVAADPLMEVADRVIDERRSATSTNERAVVTNDILTPAGITTTSSPIRYTTNSILDGGNGTTIGASDEYRIEYDYALDALLQAVIVFDREVAVKRENIGGTWYWVLHYLATYPDATKASVVQDTLGADENATAVRNIKDNWDRTEKVRVLGEGSGENAVTGTSGAGGAGTRRGVVPLKAIASSGLAGNAAGTLQTAFGSDRNVPVVNLELGEPTQDATVDLGYLVTLNDDNGASIGNYRLVYLEVDEEGADGWLSRGTFLHASAPVLPSLTQPAGVRPPGLVDPEVRSDQYAKFAQITDAKPEGVRGAQVLFLRRSTPAAAIPAGGAADILSSASHLISGGLADLGKNEGFLIQLGLDVDALSLGSVASHTHTYDKADSPSGSSAPGTDSQDAGGGATNPHAHTVNAHTHGITHTSTASGSASPAVSGLAGPFLVEVLADFAGTGGTTVLAQQVLPHLPQGNRYLMIFIYIFAAEGDPGDFSPTAVRVRITNFGSTGVTFGGTGFDASSCTLGIWRNTLHKHND
jgi:hypothetical protein